MGLILLILGIALAAAMAVGTVSAAKPSGPHITGGGITTNDNAFPGTTGIAHGGFNARATGPEADSVWPARGQFQGKSIFEGTISGVSRVHGDVVCIADRGDGIWELRIHITKSTFDDVPVMVGPAAVDTYGSIFVRDNAPEADEADENFDVATQLDAGCGDVDGFALEPSLGGNIVVHG